MHYCASCNVHACNAKEEGGKFPKVCPCNEDLNYLKDIYNEEENYKLAHFSALVEKEGYCVKTRIEETIDFFKKCGYKKIGFAFCVGLRKEMAEIYKIFVHNGFEVTSVICKCGRFPKETVGIKDEEKINPGKFETMCNPIGQAMLLNGDNTEFNVLVGLCVGHDSLVLKYLEKPATILAVKDRVTGHNPLVPIYLKDTYYKRLMK